MFLTFPQNIPPPSELSPTPFKYCTSSASLASAGREHSSACCSSCNSAEERKSGLRSYAWQEGLEGWVNWNISTSLFSPAGPCPGLLFLYPKINTSHLGDGGFLLLLFCVLSLVQGLADFGPWTKSRRSVFVKFNWNTAILTYLSVVCGCFCALTAELNSCNTDCMACKAYASICCLVLYRKTLPTSVTWSVREMYISSNNITLSLLLAKSLGFIMLKHFSLLGLVHLLLRVPYKLTRLLTEPSG